MRLDPPINNHLQANSTRNRRLPACTPTAHGRSVHREPDGRREGDERRGARSFGVVRALVVALLQRRGRAYRHSQRHQGRKRRKALGTERGPTKKSERLSLAAVRCRPWRLATCPRLQLWPRLFDLSVRNCAILRHSSLRFGFGAGAILSCCDETRERFLRDGDEMMLKLPGE